MREVTIDDLAFVNEPACGSDPFVVDGGFESAVTGAVVTPWVLTVSPGRGKLQILNTNTLAQSGNGVLELSLRQECSRASAATWITVPEADGTNGPALQFAYRTSTNPATTFTTNLGTGVLAEGANFVTQVVCLDPDLAGRMHRIEFSMDTGFGLCANTFANEFAWVDDIQAFTTSACSI